MEHWISSIWISKKVKILEIHSRPSQSECLGKSPTTYYFSQVATVTVTGGRVCRSCLVKFYKLQNCQTKSCLWGPQVCTLSLLVKLKNIQAFEWIWKDLGCTLVWITSLNLWPGNPFNSLLTFTSLISALRENAYSEWLCKVKSTTLWGLVAHYSFSIAQKPQSHD